MTDKPWKKLLFLSVDAAGHERLSSSREYRDLEQQLKVHGLRHSIQLIPKFAVRISDIPRALNEHKPDIVHFSGHGTASDEIVLLNEHDEGLCLQASALATLLQPFRYCVRLVVFNTCYSQALAAEVAHHIEHAIGMSSTVDDQSALAFSGALYQALAYGAHLAGALEQARAALQIRGGLATPVLIARTDQSETSAPAMAVVNSLDATSSAAVPSAATGVRFFLGEKKGSRRLGMRAFRPNVRFEVKREYRPEDAVFGYLFSATQELHACVLHVDGPRQKVQRIFPDRNPGRLLHRANRICHIESNAVIQIIDGYATAPCGRKHFVALYATDPELLAPLMEIRANTEYSTGAIRGVLEKMPHEHRANIHRLDCVYTVTIDSP